LSNSAVGKVRGRRARTPQRCGFLPRDRRGVAAVEFGVVAGVLAVLFLGVYDLGSAVYESLVLRQAIRAGALYALYYHNTPGIQSTIEASMPSGWTDASVYASGWAPTTTCTCTSSGGTITASPSCSCANGSTMQQLMTLTVTRPFSPLLLTTITQVSAQDVIRFQ
jgi:Flp pilus assembly protein TadG